MNLPTQAPRRESDPLAAALASAESILRGLDVGIVVVDQHYDILRINTAARRVLGIHGTAFDQDFVLSRRSSHRPPSGRRSTGH